MDQIRRRQRCQGGAGEDAAAAGDGKTVFVVAKNQSLNQHIG